MSFRPRLSCLSLRSTQVKAASLLAMAALAPLAAAQSSCDGTWVPTLGPTGVDGNVYAMAKWDPDGPGPLPEGVLMGGKFAVAGNVVAKNIAWWNPQTSDFMALGDGLNEVTAVGVTADGRALAGGTLNMPGLPACNVAVWDGVSWSAVGGPIDDSPFISDPYTTPKIRAVAGLQDGSIIVGGNFSTVAGVHTGSVVSWDGQHWVPLGGTPINSATNSLLFRPVSHELFVGTDGGTYRVGETLEYLGGPAAFHSSFDDGGTLYASNEFSGHTISSWNGSWQTLLNSYYIAFQSVLGGDAGHYSYVRQAYQAAGTRGLDLLNIDLSASAASASFGMSSSVECLERIGPSSLLAGGNFRSYGSIQPGLQSQYQYFVPSALLGQPAKFESGALRPLSTSRAIMCAVKAIAQDDGTVAAIVADGYDSRGVVVGGASAGWTDLSFPNQYYDSSATEVNEVAGLTSLADGSLVAIHGGVVYHRVNGSWVAIGVAYSSLNQPFLNGNVDLVGLPNGDLIVASLSLTQINGIPVHGIARWDGRTWSSICSGFETPNSGAYPRFHLAAAPNGDLVVAGSLTSIDAVPIQGVARWDGAGWHAVGAPGLTNPTAVSVGATGHIVVVGQIGTPSSTQYGVREWSGASWAAMPAPLTAGSQPTLACVQVRENGDIVVGGLFSQIDGVDAKNIARWDGVAWRPIGNGLEVIDGPFSVVSSLSLDHQGGLYAGGLFSHSGNVVSYGLAHAVFAGDPPTITQQPQDAATCPGYGVSFHVGASSDGSLSYRWTLDNAPIDGATNPSALTDTLTVETVYPFGSYRCVVSNGCGSVTSNPVTLGVAPCCADFNIDGVVDQGDVDAMINMENNPYGLDFDFNHDGVADQGDVDALINYIAGGACP